MKEFALNSISKIKNKNKALIVAGYIRNYKPIQLYTGWLILFGPTSMDQLMSGYRFCRLEMYRLFGRTDP